MTFPEFEKLLADMKADHERTHALYKMGVSIMDANEAHYKIVNALGNAAFGKDQWDTVTWFLWERKDDGTDQMWDADGKPMCRDVQELWEYVSGRKKVNR